jgi:hypothetical protein
VKAGDKLPSFVATTYDVASEAAKASEWDSLEIPKRDGHRGAGREVPRDQVVSKSDCAISKPPTGRRASTSSISTRIGRRRMT